jgi:hypothetical protein
VRFFLLLIGVGLLGYAAVYWLGGGLEGDFAAAEWEMNE